VDVILKMLCAEIDPQNSPGSITAYHPIIFGRYKYFHTLKIHLRRAQMACIPWRNWTPDSRPTWWTDHNDVKHHRNEHFPKANLGNVLESACGLLVALVYLCRDEIRKGHLNPTMFNVFALEWGIEIVMMSGGTYLKGSDFNTMDAPA
jgi:hypothetical protein